MQTLEDVTRDQISKDIAIEIEIKHLSTSHVVENDLD